MAAAIVGRDDELTRIESFLAVDEAVLRTLVVSGEPGIGKTTIWRRGLEIARERGLTVLSAQPAEPESMLPYAALGDVLRPIEDRIAELAESLRGPLEVALHQRVARTAPDELAVGRATCELLASEPGGLVVGIDDAQWLDAPSMRALAFALRRLGAASVRVLVARRTGHALPEELERALSEHLEDLELPPLGAAALDRLIRERLGLQLPRPALVRLTRTTAGNPLYALQVARTFDAAERTFSVPPTLADALASRIREAPDDVREMLLLTSCCIQPTVRVLERAEPGVSGLRRAVDLGLLETVGARVRFSHPLLASVTADLALPGERRAAHRHLAELADDPLERALHLARGAEEPDGALAGELESAARLASAESGPEIAAELFEAAARLTPAADVADARRRISQAAELHVAAGDPARGRQLIEQTVRDLEPGPERAALLWRLADTIGDSIDEPIRLCRQALEEAGDDAALRAEIHTALGVFTWIAGDLEGATEHCRQAVRFAEIAGDDERLAVAIGEMCHAEAILGVPWDRAAMERALAIEQRRPSVPPSQSPSFQLAVISLITDDLETARPLLEAELERARDAGDEPATFHALFRMAELELRAGRWAAALRAAREAQTLTRQGGIEQELAAVEMALALVLAHLGQHDEATRLAESAYATADAGGDKAVTIRSAGVLGFVALSAGEPEAALEWLTPAREELERMGTGELSISGIVQNEIDALVALGRLDDAERVVRFVQDKADRSGRAWHRAIAARGRAQIAAARGDAEAARASLEEALAAHRELPQPFELGRTLLVAGQIERRFRARGAAREALVRALELFDELGAAAWAEKAAAELARIPGRARASRELTETERRVAELVAGGLSNKEVAARLFVTVRTVEANLTKVYAKLGVRSRTELASRLHA